MKSIHLIRPLWWVLLLAGLFMVSLSFALRFARDELDRVRRLSGVVTDLRDLQAVNRRELEELSLRVEGQVTAPRTLLADGPGKGMLFFSNEKTTPLPEGYRHHSLTLALEGFPPDALPELLDKLENASPPWRVRRLRLASAGERLNGELLLEALDKSPPEL